MTGTVPITRMQTHRAQIDARFLSRAIARVGGSGNCAQFLETRKGLVASQNYATNGSGLVGPGHGEPGAHGLRQPATKLVSPPPEKVGERFVCGSRPATNVKRCTWIKLVSPDVAYECRGGWGHTPLQSSMVPCLASRFPTGHIFQNTLPQWYYRLATVSPPW